MFATAKEVVRAYGTTTLHFFGSQEKLNFPVDVNVAVAIMPPVRVVSRAKEKEHRLAKVQLTAERAK